jgi:hypothetical protein
MQWVLYRILILLLVLMLPATNHGVQGALSPEAAYRQYISALFRADPDAVMAVITGKPDQMAFIRTFIDCVRASNAFREKYIAAYGQPEWEKFAQDESGAGVKAFRLPGKIPLATYRELLERKPVQQGRYYIVRGENGDLRIIRQEGKWYLVAESLGFEGRQAQYDILAAVLREYMTRIGAPGLTPTEIRVAMKKAIQQTGLW